MTAYNAFPFNVINNPIWRATLTKLQQVIVDRTYGTVKFSAYGDPTVTATLNSISEAVESAFVLVEKATLPKAMTSIRSANQRSFSFAGEGIFAGLSANLSVTAEQARKTATKWLAVAQFLDAEEKIEAKKKAETEAEAKKARTDRLNELAHEHFEEYFEDLGPKKTSAIEEIYRLETIIAEEDAA